MQSLRSINYEHNNHLAIPKSVTTSIVKVTVVALLLAVKFLVELLRTKKNLLFMTLSLDHVLHSDLY